ncbi:MAG TPA: hypothetical protein VII38_15895 [Polyangia bacterium]
MTPRPFSELRVLPAEWRVPLWLSALVAVAIAAGLALGWSTAHGRPGFGLVRSTFFAAAFAYATISLVDFAEHARLERLLTGRLLAWQAVPFGESVNHVLTFLTLLAILIFARPLPPTLQTRDLLILAAPALFLALAWRDELVYHRRRTEQRENILHTTAHLAAGVMLTTFYVMRLRVW